MLLFAVDGGGLVEVQREAEGRSAVTGIQTMCCSSQGSGISTEEGAESLGELEETAPSRADAHAHSGHCNSILETTESPRQQIPARGKEHEASHPLRSQFSD